MRSTKIDNHQADQKVQPCSRPWNGEAKTFLQAWKAQSISLGIWLSLRGWTYAVRGWPHKMRGWLYEHLSDTSCSYLKTSTTTTDPWYGSAAVHEYIGDGYWGSSVQSCMKQGSTIIACCAFEDKRGIGAWYLSPTYLESPLSLEAYTAFTSSDAWQRFNIVRRQCQC